MVCSVLVIINLISNRGYFWAIWPIIGWGIGIGSHAFCTFISLENLTKILYLKELEKNRKKGAENNHPNFG